MLAALPWLWAVDPRLFKSLVGKVTGWVGFVGAILAAAIAGVLMFSFLKGSSSFDLFGRGYGAALANPTAHRSLSLARFG